MDERKKQMTKLLDSFKGSPDRQKKYMELLLLGQDAVPLSYQKRKDLRRVAVVPTTKCNLTCVWCHRQEDRFRDYLHKEMPFEMLKKILKNLKEFTWLHYGGLGEPFVYPHIFDAIKEAKKYIPNVKVTTNGTLLGKENCKKLIESGLTYLEVSIDGFDKDTNIKMRGVHEDSIIENLKYLSNNSSIPIQINSVVADVNYESLFDAVDKLKDVKNIVMYHTIPLLMTKHMQGLGINGIGDKKHKKLIQHWQNRRKALKLDFDMWPNLEETEIELVITMKRKRNLCFQVYDDPFINVFGYLCPCGRSQEICLDNVAEYDFKKAWNGPKMLDWRANHLKGDYPETCQLACGMKNTCILQEKRS